MAMSTQQWLRQAGIELIESSDALLGRGERGGNVRLGRYRNEVCLRTRH